MGRWYQRNKGKFWGTLLGGPIGLVIGHVYDKKRKKRVNKIHRLIQGDDNGRTYLKRKDIRKYFNLKTKNTGKNYTPLEKKGFYVLKKKNGEYEIKSPHGVTTTLESVVSNAPVKGNNKTLEEERKSSNLESVINNLFIPSEVSEENPVIRSSINYTPEDYIKATKIADYVRNNSKGSLTNNEIDEVLNCLKACEIKRFGDYFTQHKNELEVKKV